MYDKKLKIICIASVLTALIVVFTMLFPIPIPGAGFVFLGDFFIYIAAVLLPMPYAMATAALGGVLSDILLSYTIYAPFTFVIKPLLVLCFTSKKHAVLCKRNMIAPIFAAIITMGGYFLADWILFGEIGGFAQAFTSLPFNALQAGISGVALIITGFLLDKIKIKSILRINKR
jgi:uncharacterized repeat protein (TIGR04002 family)